MAVNALVITGYGTNSHLETAHAARLAGADRADVVYFADIVTGKTRLADYHFLIFPGGFLDGDNLGAAQTAAMRWRYLCLDDGTPLLDSLNDFLAQGKLVLGICNGFQLLVKLGVLPALGGERFNRQVSLGHNNSARFEDRWTRLLPNPQCPCIFTKNLPLLTMPVRHGEGKIVALDDECLERLAVEGLIALQYADPKSGEATQAYPHNPNGSPFAIAGLTEPTGRVLGLMPHPEAFHHVTNHPGWTRGELDPPGTILFVNAVRHLREHVC
ncbi:MAG: phosphoribosylformylglycinamidine synthase subunit PurQ [Desulfovibrio sp.]|jgi:phosphoribosylformylglycinamidine synthase|nr:phosphoribosylformylglycinamidine synthase subunit PurQ [Desulfovibrio sp.]